MTTQTRAGQDRRGTFDARPRTPRDVLAWLRAAVRFVLDMSLATIRISLRYRVTGLAAEAGFFALLSLPPLVLGLVGSVGYVGKWVGGDVVDALRDRIAELAETFLTQESVSSVIIPTFDDVLSGGRADVISIGFLLSLWSGSRVLNVFVDTISIMYGLGGHRGIVRTRVLSFSLYVAGLVVGVVVIPLVLIGPDLLGRALTAAGHEAGSWIAALSVAYWPFVTVSALFMLTALFHVSTPVRVQWYRDLPGAILTLVIWVLASFLLRWVLTASVGGASIYGPLAAPIVVLIWFYALSIAVLIGAALNAAFEERWPHPKRVAYNNARTPEQIAAATAAEHAKAGRAHPTTDTVDDDAEARS